MPKTTKRRSTCSAATLLLTALLAGCGANVGAFPPPCPKVGILGDAADLTRFRGNGTDITDTVVDGRITGLGGKCSLDDLKHLRTVVSVNMDITRGPAAQGRVEDVTYFVSVARGTTILDKRTFTLPVSFPANTDRLRLTGDQIDLVLPVSDTVSGAAYSVLVGFQLTPAQLAFNRRRGPR